MHTGPNLIRPVSTKQHTELCTPKVRWGFQLRLVELQCCSSLGILADLCLTVSHTSAKQDVHNYHEFLADSRQRPFSSSM